MLYTYKKYLLILLLFSIKICAQSIFWIEGVSQKIQDVNFDGTNQSTLVSPVGAAYGIAADFVNNKLFWVDNTAKAIMCSNLDGTNEHTVINQAAGNITIPRGIAVDDSAKKIYWTDNGLQELLCANYDGSNVTTLVTGLDCPGFVTFDSVYKKVYWADNGISTKKIQRCNWDGSNVEDVVTDLNQVWGIAIEDSSNSIYWIDSGIGKIQRGSLSNSLPVTKVDVVTGLTNSERGLVIDGKTDHIYWASTSGDIVEAYLNGSGMKNLVTGITYPQGITLTDSTTKSHPLPVELLSFTSTLKANCVVLTWETATEVNCYGFNIQRLAKTAADSWIKIGFIKGSGNSNSSKSYSFVDNNPAPGKLEYRLKQVDNDGKFKYSDVVDIKVVPAKYELYQNYPNPFNPTTTINYDLPKESKVVLKLYNILGREVAALVNEEQQAGVYKIQLSANRYGLASGVYIYRITAGKFHDAKKLMLLK